MRLEGYNGYEIYPETGQVWSYKSNRFIGALDKDGYLMVGLVSDNGKHKTCAIHRLIWEVMYGKIPEGMQINHIDEDKLNNSIFNLNLMTPKENCNWGNRNERILKNRKGKYIPKPILALQDGVIKMYFPSTREAERNGFFSSSICNCCLGKSNTSYGYKWRYLNDQLADWLEEIQDEDMANEKVA